MRGVRQLASGLTVLGIAGVMMGSPMVASGRGGGVAAESPDQTPAGPSGSYTPTGTIVADSGFRPDANGFSFENYGGNPSPSGDLNAASMERLFGGGVCESGTGDGCVLVPQARAKMEEFNESIRGGHCYGFALTAERFFANRLRPPDFGASTVPQLMAGANVPLQRKLAENWAVQLLPEVQKTRYTVEGPDPNDLLNKLAQGLAKGTQYTLIFFKRDNSGGHAVTPYAVEDNGGGLYHVLIYDNNYPGVTRAFNFDTNAHSWSYSGSPNPADAEGLYEGDVKSGTIALDSLSPARLPAPCTFCPPPARPSPSSPRSLDEVSLQGDTSNEAHLVLTDPQGRRTGVVKGVLRRQIPGVSVVVPTSDKDWRGRQDPTYRFPARSDLRLTVDGSALSADTTTELKLVGPGGFLSVSNIRLRPGERDSARFLGNGRSISYFTHRAESPSVGAGYVSGQNAYVFSAAALGTLTGGTQVRIAINASKRRLQLDLPGNQANARLAVGFQRYTRAGYTNSFGPKAFTLPTGFLAHLYYAGYRGRRVAVTVTPPGGRARLASLNQRPPRAAAARVRQGLSHP